MLWNDSGRGTVGLLVIFGQSASIVLVRVSIALERPEFQIPNSGIPEFGPLQSNWKPYIVLSAFSFVFRFLLPPLKVEFVRFYRFTPPYWARGVRY